MIIKIFEECVHNLGNLHNHFLLRKVMVCDWNIFLITYYLDGVKPNQDYINLCSLLGLF